MKFPHNVMLNIEPLFGPSVVLVFVVSVIQNRNYKGHGHDVGQTFFLIFIIFNALVNKFISNHQPNFECLS